MDRVNCPSWHPPCPHWDGETWIGSSERNFHLLLRYSCKPVLLGLNRSDTETRGDWMWAYWGWKAFDLALESFLLAVGKVVIASPQGLALPQGLASPSEALRALSILALLLEVSLALLNFVLSKAAVASLLPPSGASTLALRLRVLLALLRSDFALSELQ